MKIRHGFDRFPLPLGILLLFTVCVQQLHAQGLVASWMFSGDASDATGNGHNGTVYGATPTADRFGNASSAYRFDGVNDYITVPHDAIFNIDTAYAVSLWLKFCTLEGDDPSFNTLPCLFGKAGGNTVGYGIVLWNAATQRLIGLHHTWSNTNPSYVLFTRPVMDDGRWHHVVFVGYDSAISAGPIFIHRIYIDGQLDALGTGPKVNYSSDLADLIMGKDPRTSYPYNGGLDDIRFYNRRLTASEVAGIYGEGGWPASMRSITAHVAAIPTTPVCRGDSVQLSATGGESYSWSPSTGLSSSTVANPKAAPPVTTKYTVTAMRTLSPNFCPDELRAVDTVTVTVREAPKLTSTQRVIYACQGDSMQLSLMAEGTGPFTYAWSPGSTLNDSTIAQPRATPKTTTLYRVTVTNSIGCKTKDSIFVTMFSPPAANAGRDTAICRGGGVKIGSDTLDNHRYAWRPRSGLNDSTLARPVATPDTTTRYIMTITSPIGCVARDTIIVKVNPAATAEAGADVMICSDSSAMIGTTAVAGYKYQWTPPVGLSDPISSTPIAKPSTTTTYYLTATNASGCTAVDSVIVSVLKPALMVDQATLDFGQLDGCTSSKDMPLVITNSGDIEIRISDATFSGTGFSIVSPPRPIDLKPGEKVTLTMRYAPTGSGPATSTLMVSGSPCSVMARVDLKGSKAQSLVSASVASIDFGRSLACTPTDSTVTITITNSGGVAATIEKTTLAAPFSIDSPTLPMTIPAGATETIIIHYKPTATGVYSSDLKLPYTSGTCHDTLRIALSGIVEQPELKPSSTMIDFGALSGCEVGHDTTIVLSNSGTFDITLDSTSIPAGYKLVTTLPLVIGAGGSRAITLRFEPASSGTSNGTLALRYSPCDGTVNIMLNGTKQGVSFSVPDSLDLGEMFSCREKPTSVSAGIIYSGDGGSGSVGSVSINGPFTTTLKAGDVLNSGVATAFDVTFVPTQDGSATGFIDLTLEPCGITRRIELTGSYASIALVPSSISFGTQPIGASTTRPVLFINSSSIPMRIEQVEGIAPPFSIASTVPTVPATLPPGDTLHILVSYQATNGTSRDTLRAIVTAPCSIVVDATLEGSGGEDATATVVLPVVEAVPGEHITLPLTLKSSDGLDALGAQHFTMDVSFNRTLLFPSGATPLGIEQGHERVVTIIGERALGMSSGELARLEFIAALGDTTYTPVVIRSFRWLDAAVSMRAEDGGVNITSQGGWKLFLSDGALRLEVKPNPANQNAEIDYEVIEPGRTRLMVRDAVGREVQRLLDAEIKPGQYGIQHDVSQLAAGAYFYVLETPTGRLVTPLVVVH